MINNNSKNNRNLIVWLNKYFNVLLIIILIIFLILAYFLFLKPKLSNAQNTLQIDIQQKEMLYTASQKKLAILMDIQKVYQNIKPNQLQKFNTVLPSYYVPDRLYGELEEIVKSGGWLVSSIKFDFEEAKANKSLKKGEKPQIPVLTNISKYPGLKKYKISLSVSAIDYAGLKRLLKVLENNLRLVDISDVNFSPSDHNATLILNTYYYQP